MITHVINLLLMTQVIPLGGPGATGASSKTDALRALTGQWVYIKTIEASGDVETHDARKVSLSGTKNISSRGLVVLRKWTSGKSVTLKNLKRVGWCKYEARLVADGKDLNGSLVAAGLAEADGLRYQQYQWSAQQRKRGMWVQPSTSIFRRVFPGAPCPPAGL